MGKIDILAKRERMEKERARLASDKTIFMLMMLVAAHLAMHLNLFALCRSYSSVWLSWCIIVDDAKNEQQVFICNLR